MALDTVILSVVNKANMLSVVVPLLLPVLSKLV
jgi:hypothetical protein